MTLGEAFNMPIGTNVTGKMVTALRRLGFDAVYDTDFAADLTIVEEATEFIERVKNGGVLADDHLLFARAGLSSVSTTIPSLSPTSPPARALSRCSAPWPRPGMPRRWASIPRISMWSAVMPCTAKKFETKNSESNAVEGLYDVDVAITTRELARMIERAGIHFTSLPDGEFDAPLGMVHRCGQHLRRHWRRYGSCPAYRGGLAHRR